MVAIQPPPLALSTRIPPKITARRIALRLTQALCWKMAIATSAGITTAKAPPKTLGSGIILSDQGNEEANSQAQELKVRCFTGPLAKTPTVRKRKIREIKAVMKTQYPGRARLLLTMP
jgi:hypothetical protein